MGDEKTESQLEHVLTSLSAGIQNERDETYREKVTDTLDQYGLKLLNPETFHLYVQYPDEEFYETLLTTVLQHEKDEHNLTYSDDTLYKLHLYYTHYDFIDRHLDRLFTSNEGLMGSSDKSRFILNHYLHELKHDRKTDWNSPVSYQVPRYGTKESWTTFIDSFYDFILGQPDAFIQAHTALMGEINAGINATADRLHQAYISHPNCEYCKITDDERCYYFRCGAHTLKLVLDRLNSVKYLCKKEERGQGTQLTHRDTKPDWVMALLNIH